MSGSRFSRNELKVLLPLTLIALVVFAIFVAVIVFLIGAVLHGYMPEWVHLVIAFLPDLLERWVLGAASILGFALGFVFWRRAEVAYLANGKLSGPPLGRIAAVLSLLVFKKTFERNFAQAIEDARQEYYEALSENAKLRAYIVLVSAHFVLVATAFALFCSFVADTFVKSWKSLK